ncbi:MAG: hypothetical protein KAW93_07385, partial [Methanogenium sp.]|nr:hypothetical protein [Methanogenium sp.]
MRKRGFSRRDSNSRYFRNVSSDIAGHPKIRNIIIFCLLVTALAFAGCISADLLDSGPKYPGISYEGSPEYENILHDFKFRDNIVSLNILIDSNLYNIAKNTDKNAYLTNEESSTNEWSLSNQQFH